MEIFMYVWVYIYEYVSYLYMWYVNDYKYRYVERDLLI